MLKISTNNQIIKDGKPTKYGVMQLSRATIVFTREDYTINQSYKEHGLPKLRYTISTKAGMDKLESDMQVAGLF